MRIVITLDIEGVEKDKTAIFVGEKPEGPVMVEMPDGKCVTLANGECVSTEQCIHTPIEETVITHNEDGTAIVVHEEPKPETEPVPVPKKRGRKRKTVDIGATEKPLVGQAAPVDQKVLEVVPPEAAIKADIPVSAATPEPAPVAATEPVPEPAKKADISIPVCPVCKEPMMADERYDAYLCIKDGQFNNSVKPSAVKAAVQAALQAMPKIVPATSEVKPIPRGLLTEEEQKDIKTRLGKYWVDILPNASMTAEDGKSINAKLTDFANTFAASREWPNSRSWDAKQWGIFLSFMDGMVGAKGAKALVAHINQEIGSK